MERELHSANATENGLLSLLPSGCNIPGQGNDTLQGYIVQ